MIPPPPVVSQEALRITLLAIVSMLRSAEKSLPDRPLSRMVFEKFRKIPPGDPLLQEEMSQLYHDQTLDFSVSDPKGIQ